MRKRERIANTGVAVVLATGMALGGVAVPLATPTEAAHAAPAAQDLGKKWYSNDREIWAPDEDLPTVVDYLNRHVESIKVSSLGGTVKETFTPADYSDDNKLLNADGTFNKDYQAKNATTEAGKNNLRVFDKVIDRFKHDLDEKLIISVTFTGTSPSVAQIIAPENLPTTNKAEDTPWVRLVKGQDEARHHAIWLKVLMEEDGMTVRSVIDNNTPSYGGNGNYWSLDFVAAGGLKVFEGKTLEQIKKLNFGTDKGKQYVGDNRYEAGPDAVAGNVGAHLDTQDMMVAYLEKLQKEYGQQADKSALLAEYKAAEVTKAEADKNEFEDNEGLKTFNAAFDKARETLRNRKATADEVKATAEALKTARESDQLVRKQVDTAELQAALAKAKAVNEAAYLPESYAVLNEAIKKAEPMVPGKGVSVAQVTAATKALTDAIADLEEKDSSTVKRFTVTGTLLQYGSENTPSMANGAFNPEVRVKEMNGKAYYYLRFKPMEVAGAKGYIETLAATKNNVSTPARLRAIKEEGGWDKEFVVERSTANEERIDMKVGAFMGSGISEQPVTLKLDLSTKKAKELKKHNIEITKDIQDELDKMKQFLGIAYDHLDGLKNDEYKLSGDEKNAAIDQLRAAIVAAEAEMADPASEDALWQARANLSKAYQNLQLKPRDLTKLEAAIKAARDADTTDGDPARVKKLKDDADEAERVLNNQKSGLNQQFRQKALDKMAAELTKLSKTLKTLNRAEYESELKNLKTAIDLGTEALEALEGDEYDLKGQDKDTVVTTLKEALAKAQDTYDAPVAEDDLYDDKSAIYRAYQNFDLKPRDLTALEKAIHKAELVDEAASDAAKVEALKKVLADAKALADAQTDRITSNDKRQKYVDAAAEKLTKAMEGLSFKADTKAELAEAIAAAKKLEQGKKSDEAFKALTDAIAKAEGVLNGETSDDAARTAAKTALTEAVKAFREAPNTDGLNWEKLPNGTYDVMLGAKQVGNLNADSMMNNRALVKATKLTVKDGVYTLKMQFQGAIGDGQGMNAQATTFRNALQEAEGGFLTKVEKWDHYTPGVDPESMDPKPGIKTVWESSKPEGEFASFDMTLSQKDVETGMFALRVTAPAMGDRSPSAALVIDRDSVKRDEQTKPGPVSTEFGRLAGSNAFGTMQKIHDAGWKDETNGTVVVATFDGYWDALAASGLAGIQGAPVVMTYGDRLSPEAEAILKAAKPSKVYVMGGEAAVSEGVKDAVDAAAGVKSQRIAGDTATGTAAAAAHEGVGSWGSEVAVLATNAGYWDALAAAPWAYAMKAPVFLTEGADSVSGETLKAMKAAGVKRVLVMGGDAAISQRAEAQVNAAGFATEKRFAGTVAVDTAAQFAEWALANGLRAEGVGLATSHGYWDALTGAALCGKTKAPIVLVDDAVPTSMERAKAFVKSHVKGSAKAHVFGGDAAISNEALEALKKAATRE
ncbi:hypothetical protein HLV37_06985 [Eggerthellaceae bacterium zg-1084]|uniref:cell wall-binding repeat-containing protein n=1 Tax=Berryella wangjianweii TaxID=2734634 RepID=UPI0015519101|nr:cell wall-binding repeat-containing protein [Berryella wangjianweii]NPD31593.1 hypothetical protein [Berryella wangjianweii]